MNKKVLIGMIAGMVVIGAIIGGVFLFKHKHTYDYEYDRFCNECGYERQINCRHDISGMIEIIPAKSATCIETGLTQGLKCLICETMVTPQTVIPVTECINLQMLPYITPTCQKTGLSEGKKCTMCGKIIVAQRTLDRIACQEGKWIVDTESTKTAEGLRHTECTMCGKKISEEIIPATGSLGLTYTLNSDGKSYSVSKGSCTDTEIFIRSVYNGKPVTNIGGWGAFSDCTSVKSVVIPDSVTSIGYCAFQNCTSLTSVIIPDSVTSIGGGAFQGCNNLTSITIPDSVISIEGATFSGCTSLTNVTIGNSVTSIDMGAFNNCASLMSIIIPKSVSYIGEQAFSKCYYLTIYCEIESKPTGWDRYWNFDSHYDIPVIWGYKGK